jgi:hypothetical protein
LIALLLAGVAPSFSQANTAEVTSALRSRYVDADRLDAKFFDEASVAGILQALAPGAVLLKTGLPASAAAPMPAAPLARAEVIEPNIGYIRLADVVEETLPALDAELKKFADAKTTGYVLDLRYADGTNYAAAAAVAGRFLSAAGDLFTIKTLAGAKVVPTELPAVPPAGGLDTAPLLMLVNSETRGSGEALAGALRSKDRGLLVGARTAGSAVAWEEIKLSDGRTLRVATAKLTLPGAEVFPNGLTPDIAVKIDPKVEREVVLAGQTNVALTATLQPRQKRTTAPEADLVRAFRGESVGRPGEAEAKPAEEEILPVRDVVLQRAVDVLKGIRVLSGRN